MKTFRDDFFALENFIKNKVDFNYLATDEGAYHVAYNVNNDFIHIMGVSVVSVLENNRNQKFVFHIFVDSYSQDNLDKIKELAMQWKCRCIVYLLDMTPFNDFHIKVARFSRITYARIYMPKVIKAYTERFIYLDADTMVCDTLNELWNIDLKGAPMGAVSESPDTVVFRSAHLKLTTGRYFNDGVMVIDTKQWEQSKITEKAFWYQSEPPSRFIGQSQDVLNLVFDGSNYFLPTNYNVYSGAANFDGHCIIAHWTGRRKPWQMVVNSYDEQWRKYNKLAPWETITNILPIKKAENYHDFQQWGRHQKSRGHYGKYLQGLFWYGVLRIIYKLGGNKKN